MGADLPPLAERALARHARILRELSIALRNEGLPCEEAAACLFAAAVLESMMGAQANAEQALRQR